MPVGASSRRRSSRGSSAGAPRWSCSTSSTSWSRSGWSHRCRCIRRAPRSAPRRRRRASRTRTASPSVTTNGRGYAAHVGQCRRGRTPAHEHIVRIHAGAARSRRARARYDRLDHVDPGAHQPVRRRDRRSPVDPRRRRAGEGRALRHDDRARLPHLGAVRALPRRARPGRRHLDGHQLRHRQGPVHRAGSRGLAGPRGTARWCR